jgi:ribokinase
VIFQLEIPLETVVYAADKLKSMGKTIILDPAPASGLLPDRLIGCTDYVKPNETELSVISGVDTANIEINTLEKASEKLIRQGTLCVLATLGKKGVFVRPKNEVGKIFAVKDVKVVDTTAAGDSWTAAFAFSLSLGKRLEEAVIFANTAATIVVQREGAQSSIPTIDEINRDCVKLH